jgi:hypothetical protein
MRAELRVVGVEARSPNAWLAVRALDARATHPPTVRLPARAAIVAVGAGAAFANSIRAIMVCVVVAPPRRSGRGPALRAATLTARLVSLLLARAATTTSARQAGLRVRPLETATAMWGQRLTRPAVEPRDRIV